MLITVGVPFDMIAMDIAGRFPITHNGNCYIVVVKDYFSKRVFTSEILSHENF